MLPEHTEEHELLRGSSTAYFFDIQQDENGNPTLVITTSTLSETPGEKPTRSSITIDASNVGEFASIVLAMANRVSRRR